MNIIRLKQQAQGFHLRCADAPDTSGQNAAALASAKLSEDQFNWFKGEYERTAPDRAEASRRANEASDIQLEAARKNNEIADDYWKYQKDVFRPVEQGLVEDAQNYDTPERRAEAAQSAGAGVEQQISAQRDATARALARSGVDPSSGKTAALMGSQDIMAAKAKAGATNAAERNVETQGWARRMDAASLGRNLASNQATSSQVATQAGSAGANTGMMPLAANQTGSSLMQTGFNGAMAGQGQAGQIYGNIANTQANNRNSGLLGSLGGVAGMFLASDENMKEDIEPTDDTAAMRALRNLDVKKWRYKEKEGLGTEEHIGPMAQDVQAEAGDGVAPGGKAIDMISMNGMTIAALQNVDRRLARVEKEKR